MKTKYLLKKVYQVLPNLSPSVCANYNLIKNFITDTHLNLRDKTAVSLLATSLVSKINDSEEVTDGS